MIELLLYFALGFLCAVFLAALVAPPLWRRGAMLAKRRIEAAVPLTLEEIRAEKDGLRAEHAVEMRRLELELKAARDKASNETVKFARRRKDMQEITSEREDVKQALAKSEAEVREAREEARRRAERTKALTAALHKTETLLNAQQMKFEELARKLEEASLSSSAQQIELVARESEIDRLNNDINSLRGLRRSSDRVTREADSRVRTIEEVAEVEKRRADSLNEKVLQLLAAVSDRDDRLERRDREVERLRERLRPIQTASRDSASEARLTDLENENKRLEAQMAALAGTDRASSNPELPTRAQNRLREQMTVLAAQVVKMTAAIEGPDSPIDRAIAKAARGPKKEMPSLAERVRILREEASD